MTNTQEQTPRSLSGRTGRMLLELGVGVHRMGYGQLCLAVPRYAEDLTQCLTKDTYPYVARQLGCTDGRAVEHAIRMAILDAWDRRDPAVWRYRRWKWCRTICGTAGPERKWTRSCGAS